MAKTGIISTVAGTGVAGFSGDGGPAAQAQLRQPHSIAVDPGRRRLLICDIGNHRIRSVTWRRGTIDTFAGTGERQPTPDGAPLQGTPLNGPRTMAFDRDGRPVPGAARGQRDLPHRSPDEHASSCRRNRRAGLHRATAGRPGWPSWPAQRDWPGRAASCTSPTPRTTSSARIDLDTGVITTVLGTGQARRRPGAGAAPVRALTAARRAGATAAACSTSATARRIGFECLLCDTGTRGPRSLMWSRGLQTPAGIVRVLRPGRHKRNLNHLGWARLW